MIDAINMAKSGVIGAEHGRTNQNQVYQGGPGNHSNANLHRAKAMMGAIVVALESQAEPPKPKLNQWQTKRITSEFMKKRERLLKAARAKP
jgi:hypothetical protein